MKRSEDFERDIELISAIMQLFCLMSPEGKRKMAYILKITVDALDKDAGDNEMVKRRITEDIQQVSEVVFGERGDCFWGKRKR